MDGIYSLDTKRKQQITHSRLGLKRRGQYSTYNGHMASNANDDV